MILQQFSNYKTRHAIRAMYCFSFTEKQNETKQNPKKCRTSLAKWCVPKYVPPRFYVWKHSKSSDSLVSKWSHLKSSFQISHVIDALSCCFLVFCFFVRVLKDFPGTWFAFSFKIFFIYNTVNLCSKFLRSLLLFPLSLREKVLHWHGTGKTNEHLSWAKGWSLSLHSVKCKNRRTRDSGWTRACHH